MKIVSNTCIAAIIRVTMTKNSTGEIRGTVTEANF